MQCNFLVRNGSTCIFYLELKIAHTVPVLKKILYRFEGGQPFELGKNAFHLMWLFHILSIFSLVLSLRALKQGSFPDYLLCVNIVTYSICNILLSFVTEKNICNVVSLSISFSFAVFSYIYQDKVAFWILSNVILL